MNDNLMFDYLLEMGAMRPEQEEMKRRQAMVEALRGNAMKPLEGQMVGKHYVAPGIANAIAQMGSAYMAGQQQKGLDAQAQQMNATQRQRLEELRRRRGMAGGTVDVEAPYDLYGQFAYPSRT
jgi:DNA-binding transcriptional regulator YbjK